LSDPVELHHDEARNEPPTPRRARRAGILLHPTSLPGPHGIGDLGEGAYRFVDFLVAARQHVWQVLPLGPIGYGNSPYAGLSAFAGNPLLICLDTLRADGLLTADDLAAVPPFDDDRVDFEGAAAWKLDRLRRAYGRLLAPGAEARREALDAFARDQAGWLDDFALFMALQGAHDGAPWHEWGLPIRERSPEALAAAKSDLAGEVGFQQFLQFLFAEQWGALKRYANACGVAIMGDLPIFVAHDSADVWAHPGIFTLDTNGAPTVVAGVPPDYFSATGQRWGNPIYRWEVIAGAGYRWWIERFRALLRTVDSVRIDHFRGFEQCWEIPADHPTAEHGRWVAGPGAALFDAIRAELGAVPLVAEDLGTITPAVEALRRALGVPGMRVLQFAFGGDATNPYLPHNYEPDTVVYTGTHDNDTTAGWYAAAGEHEREAVCTYLARDGSDIAHDLVRLAYASVADTTIAPLQDVLSLGSEARMNLPGRPEANWTWRYRPEMLRDEEAAWLAALVHTYGRDPTPDVAGEQSTPTVQPTRPG